jgi:beta-glucuronidase
MKIFYLGITFCTLILQNLWGQSFQAANPKHIALFPQQNTLRNALDLSGYWNFQKDSTEIGERDKWFEGLPASRAIAVPGSWNEQFTDSRDYLGLAWYETNAWFPASWKGQRIFLRVGSANYAAKLWVNGKPLGVHEGGHLPFAFEITQYLRWDAKNRITISIENVLKPGRVPTGGISGSLFQSNPKANFDFFPYAGLNRAVWAYSVPSTASIEDVRVVTGFSGTTGKMEVQVTKTGKASSGTVKISGNGKEFEAGLKFTGETALATFSIPDVRLWSPEDPFLYQVHVTLGDAKTPMDMYELETGVRTIAVNEKQILLNGKPIFLKGFGKHEDFPVFGRGIAPPVLVKDHALLKWVGANSYRTSHYPYDEAYMRMADREGILIINEIPAVGLFFHGDTTELAQRQATCKQYIEELITRDKNHPSVIMWSVANEPFPPVLKLSAGPPDPAEPHSTKLFEELFQLVKKMDPTRLATVVGVMGGPIEWLALSDVVCINRYWGWYTNPGDIPVGAALLSQELDDLYAKLKRPIVVSEFGADTYPGMHAEQPEMFTEEYQTEFLKAYLDVADTKDFVAGMHVWAFADFKTGQGTIRFGGINYKGVFTRDRKPKAAAHFLRSRWNP